MTIELSDTDIIFIYGHFQKQLAEIDKIATLPDCPFDEESVKNNKAPYLSVVEKLRSQFPDLSKMDRYL